MDEGAFGRGQEGRFLWRVLALIVVWSIPGGAAGAAAGVALAFAGLGPDGTTGLMVQVVSWLIIGHLLAGMLAGYLLLADRSQREMAPDRAAFVVTVRCRTGTEHRAALRALSGKD